MGRGENKTNAGRAPRASEIDMMEQYARVKEKYRDALLFYRFGDFYELFYDDAVQAARVLDIVLTTRPQGKDRSRVPMCGVPHHRLDFYLARLVEKGHKVAICEQIQGTAKGRGLIEREVVRVVTPGTLYESERQEGAVAALRFEDRRVGVAFVRLATGEFLVTDVDRAELPATLTRLRPEEILLPAGERLDQLPLYRPFVAERPAEAFAGPATLARLTEHFGREAIEPLKLSTPSALAAAGALLVYLQETQMAFLPHLQAPKPYANDEFVCLDAQTQRNLELVENLFQGTAEGTLLAVLDHSATSMGRRRLRQWLLHPLRRVEAIEARQEAIAELAENHRGREELRETLAGILDIERLTSRVTSAIANPRDLARLRASIAPLPRLRELVGPADAPFLRELHDRLDTLADLHADIARVLVDEPRALPRDGGLIRAGVSAELDELQRLQHDASGWLAEFESRERERSRIPNLKVGFNKIHGYYIEVTKSYLRAVPADYQRRQTLVNAERFMTEPLRQFEAKTLSAAERAKELEYELFVALRDRIASHAGRLRHTAEVLGTLDVIAALAQVAASKGWIRPEISNDDRIAIHEGRHPVVEALTSSFVPNDLYLDESKRFLLLTGPNAAGKSTYVRQAAVLTLLAHTGSFVPAQRASIGVVDRIFTRVGAADFLARGLSTFMVEMMETTNILRYATRRSLVILDEVGRGTGSADGQAIAQAVAEALAQTVGAKTLFTTHYHQLAALADRIPAIANAHLAVREDRDEVTFLYKVMPGATEKSYGIYVARLAGLPAAVVERAAALLQEWEGKDWAAEPRVVAARESNGAYGQQEALLARLRQTDPLHTTPIEALHLLSELKALASPPAEHAREPAAEILPVSLRRKREPARR